MKKSKRILAVVMAVIMVFCYMPGMAFADDVVTVATTKVAPATSQFSDMPDNWSTAALNAAANNGLIKGYESSDGLLIKASGTLTRAEMATVVNRAFGATETASLSGVADVPSNAWYAAELAKAVKMGAMKLDTQMRPNANITRQETFTILARAFKQAGGTSTDLVKFSDGSSVASYAVDGMGALIKNGYVSGNNNKLNSTSNITRAEFAKIMDNMVKQYYKTGNTVESFGNVMINESGTKLVGATVNGDLIIGDGVGNGNVTLDSVTVTGNTIIRGGGINSIIIKGNSNLGNVIVSKVDGNVRVSVEGNAEVEVIYINDGKGDVLVEGKIGTLTVGCPDVPVVVQKAEIAKVEVTVGGANLKIAKDSTVEELNVEAKADLKIEGKVTKVQVTNTAEGTNVDISKDAKVTDLKVDTKVTTTGEGKADKVSGTGSVTEKGKEQTPAVTSSRKGSSNNSGTLDTSALDNAITTANEAKVGVAISVNGEDVSPGKFWVTQAVNDALDTAIAIATTALGTVTTAQDVTHAAAALNEAVETYNTDGTWILDSSLEASDVKIVQEGNNIKDHQIGFHPPIDAEKKAEVEENFKGWLVIYSEKNKIEVGDYLKGLTEEQIEDYGDTNTQNRIYEITTFNWADGVGNSYRANQKDVVTGKEFGPGVYYLYVATYTNDGIVALAQADKNIDIKPSPRNVKLESTGAAIEEYDVGFSSFNDERITHNLIFYSKNVIYRDTIQELLSKNKAEVEALAGENKAKLTEALTGPISFNVDQTELDGIPFGEGIYYIYVATVGNEGILGISYAIETIITEPNPGAKVETIREGKGIVFPIGGATSDKNFDYILASAKEGPVETPRIAIFNSSRDDYATVLNHFYYKDPTYGSLEDTFTDKGFEPVFIPLSIDSAYFVANNTYYSNLVKSCDAVLLQGGDQNKHAKSLLNDDGTDTEIMKAIRYVITRGGIVAGTSAGMHVMSNPVFGYGTSDIALQTNETESYEISDIPTTGDLFPETDNNNLAVPGIGIVPNNVLNDTHFDVRGRLGRLIVGLRDTEKEIGIGCDEGTGLAISNNIGTVVGDQGVFIVDRSGATYGEKGSDHVFGVTGLKIHYLTEGDMYNFDTKGITTAVTKTEIVENDSSETHETEDIFGEYETTKTIISFALNNADNIIRKVKTTGAPFFNVTFSKDENTKAYTSTLDYIDDELAEYNKATIIGMNMDVTEREIIIDEISPVISGVNNGSDDYTVYILITDENSGIDEETVNEGTVELISETNTMYETSPQYELDYDDIKVSINEDAYVAGDKLVISGIKDLAGNEVETQTWEKQEDGNWEKQ